VISLCVNYRQAFTKDDRIRMCVEVYPPDKRRRDLDNLMKATADSLQHAQVYPDDSQIDDLRIIRMPTYAGQLLIFMESI